MSLRSVKSVKKPLIFLLIFTMIFGLVGIISEGPVKAAVSTKITLTPSMVTNESGLGDAGMLVDEQALAGDPPTGACNKAWFPGYTPGVTYPKSAYIDLGQNYVVTKVYLRDVNAIANYTVATGTPGSWTTLFTDSLANYNVWNAHDVSVTTRYIRCTMEAQSSNMAEIVVYGYPVAVPTATPTPTTTPTPTSTPTATPTPTTTPTPTPVSTTPAKLTLTTSMITNEAGLGNAGMLVDEQTLAGDPPSGACTTAWFPGYTPGVTYPKSAYIDLGQNYVITKIYWFNTEVCGTLKNP